MASVVRDEEPEATPRETTPSEKGVSRRTFIRSAAAATVAAPVLLDACATESPPEGSYVGAPSPAVTPETPGKFRFLTANEAAVLSGLLDRVLPGAPGVPSASEAGVIDFVDQRLARDQDIPTYTKPPFARTYEGPTPPGPDTEEIIWVPAAEIYRYGVQEVELASADVYRRGVRLLDQYCTKRFKKPFAELTKKQQGIVWDALSNGKVDTFVKSPTSSHFLNVLSSDAAQGWLSDPMYGGNHNMVVWKAIGYPAAQRAYTPEEMRSGQTNRKPQSFAEMHASVAGEPQSGVLLPEAGTEAGDVSGPSESGPEFECRTTPA
jgi:gluconate 2-dehydrogenase gamma chain